MIRTIMNGFLGACAVGILALLYLKAQAVDLNGYHEVRDTVRQLKELDARWNEDILRAKLSLDTNYDSLTNRLGRLTGLEQNLETTLQDLVAENAVIQTGLSQYKRLLTEKTELIEQFKGQNSILRNSLRFIPVAIADLLDEIEREQAQGSEPAVLKRLATQAQALLQSVLEFNLLSQEDLAIQLQDQIGRLDAEKDGYTDTIGQQLAIILAHAQTILIQKPQIDALLANIIAMPTASSIDSLYESYTGIHEQRLLENDQYRTLLIIFSALLLIWIAYMGFRLRNSYRALDHANAQLQTANQGLEQRVAERTQELSRAYDELKQSQLRLVQSEKMASLGQMVAGVVHEINTPLAYTRSNILIVKDQLVELANLANEAGHLDWLLNNPNKQMENLQAQAVKVSTLARSLREDAVIDEMDQLLQASASGIDQISDLVINLKNFSRLDRKKVERVSLNEGLDSVLLIARNTLKHKIQIVKDYQDIPFVSCSPSQINQVLLNLIVNAAQAIEDQGTISLRTIDGGDYVEIIIEDNGKGIPEDVLPKIFDPFFTTKEIGEGTGLGLSIAFQIIQQHGGDISVESKVGQGTRFTISLPVSESRFLAKTA